MTGGWVWRRMRWMSALREAPMKRVAYGPLLGLGAVLAAALPVAHSRPVVRLDSSTAVLAGHKNTIGNGSYNHNAVSINSPTRNKGPVATSNANAGGRTSTRAGFCKKKRHCLIIQE